MNHRVLVADDDPDLLEVVVMALTMAGDSVVTATTGAELLERMADDGAFDLVITDISMPGMSGLQVASSVRSAGVDVPLIVMTGGSDASLPARVALLGERALLLRKPFDLRQLYAAMAGLLDARPASKKPVAVVS